MASICKRGAYQFQCSIRRKGYPVQVKTFETRRDAEAWARSIENAMDRGVFVDRSELETLTLGKLLERYRDEVTCNKRGWQAEASRIKQWLKHPLALRTLASLRSSDFAAYRDSRLKQVSATSVRHEINLVSTVLNTARKDWSINVVNVIEGIRKPKPGRARDRRLTVDEESRLLAACADSLVRAPDLVDCVALAIETGMRAGEIANMEWSQVDLAHSCIRLDMTKNGDSRTIPLSGRAEQLLRGRTRPLKGGKVFSFYDSNGMSAAFRRACERADIMDLHFHDLRHEAASRMAPHLPSATLSKIFGWRSIQMSMRYYNPTNQDLVDAVRKAEAARKTEVPSVFRLPKGVFHATSFS